MLFMIKNGNAAINLTKENLESLQIKCYSDTYEVVAEVKGRPVNDWLTELQTFRHREEAQAYIAEIVQKVNEE